MTTSTSGNRPPSLKICGSLGILHFVPPKTDEIEDRNSRNILHRLSQCPSNQEIKQYIGVLICGTCIWGISWFLLKETVLPGGDIFNMIAVVVIGYVVGHTMERYTTITPVVGMTLVGALYRNLGSRNFLLNPLADGIDYHLRRIYPAIILVKGPLGWNWDYIKNNSVKVFSLATLPWLVECLSIAVFAHVLFEFPWYWSLHLGAILSSVSPAVVVPTVSSFSARGLGAKNQIALLVANAGGLDTAFTEGMCGVINTAIFYPASIAYRVVKASMAVFVGIALGIVWGVLVDYIPEHKDPYAAAIKSIMILTGGLLLTYATGFVGWGGTSGVAIMICAGAAATRWARRGWAINKNPVADTYYVLWRIFEPMLFTLSGYYLEVSTISGIELGRILICLTMALLLRMLTALLVALANEYTVRESLFISITWIPKAIVEAVLVRVAADSLWSVETPSNQDTKIAQQHSNIIVIAILITSTLGSALTNLLGPLLLSKPARIEPDGIYRTSSITPSTSTDKIKNITTISSLDL